MIQNVPWNVALSHAEHTLVMFFLGAATLGFLAALVRTWLSQGEVGARYRASTVARLGGVGVAFLTYAFMLWSFSTSYLPDGPDWSPTADTINVFAPRYIGWAVSVPLLAIELLAVCAVAGIAARKTRAVSFASSTLMVFIGYLGAFVLVDDASHLALLVCFAISGVFYVVANVVLIAAVRRSMRSLTPEAGVLLKRATTLLLGGWVLYPLIALIQVLPATGTWVTTMQIAFCVADVTIKVGFGTLIHRVAKLRTAEDVRAGVDVHPESIWISSVKLSDAGRPAEVFLARDEIIHDRRAKPPTSVAVATNEEAVVSSDTTALD